MAERSLSIWLYMLGHAMFGRRSRRLERHHDRPAGRVIWVHCHDSGDIAGVSSVVSQMFDQYEPATFVLTGTGQEPGTMLDGLILLDTAPRTAQESRRFIRHWKPSAMVWLGSALCGPVLATLDTAGIPRVWANAENSNLRAPQERWVAGMRRNLLRRFAKVLTVDVNHQRGLIRLGAPAVATLATGAIEAEPPVLGCNDRERADMARIIGSRPVWLAANCSASDISFIAAAHKQALRKSLRLLLIVVPDDPARGPDIKQQFADAGFDTALRSQEDLSDATRVYVADLEGELGLWYRLSPVTFMGGTFDGVPLNPLEPAALGSVVVRGPKIAPHVTAYNKLARSDASVVIGQPTDLSGVIEMLLAPDRAAAYANNAWTVTTDGAEAINRLSEILGDILEQETT